MYNKYDFCEEWRFNYATNKEEEIPQGYYGTLPDIEADFAYKKQHLPSSNQTDMKIPVADEFVEENLKPAPFDDALFLDMVIKKEKDSDYVKDIQKTKMALTNLKNCIEEEGDILTINGGEAILDISSDLKDGSLVLLNGAKMNIADNTTLSISQDIDIIVDSANVDISEIFGFGENASVVLSGVESDNALETLSGLIKYQDEDGNLISATLTDVNNIASSVLVAVPEPAEWAMIFGCIALGFAVYRRRK